MSSKTPASDSSPERIRRAIATGTPTAMAATLGKLSAAQIADLIESLPPERRNDVWSAVAAGMKGEVLVEVHREVRRQLVEASSADELAAAVQRLDLDELSDLYDQLPREVSDALPRAMDTQRRERFDLMRGYPDDTAGGLMDVDVITVRPDISLAMVMSYLAHLRATQGTLPQELDAVDVVDLDGRFLGRLSLVDLVSRDAPQRHQHDRH